jgi:hypothetical protein
VEISLNAATPSPFVCPDCGGGQWAVEPSRLAGRIAAAKADVQQRGGVLEPPAKAGAIAGPGEGGAAEHEPMTREIDIQYEIRTFLEALGVACYSLSQGRHTRQSAGLPDLWVMHPKLGGVWLEIKAPNGRRSAAQTVFADRCARSRVQHLFASSLEPVRKLCIEAGLISDVGGERPTNAGLGADASSLR